MNTSETSGRTFTGDMSTLTILCGAFSLGLGGFFLLCLIAYAMVTENLPLGLVCGLLLFIPYILGVVWIFTVGNSLRAERAPAEAEALARVDVRS